MRGKGSVLLLILFSLFLFFSRSGAQEDKNNTGEAKKIGAERNKTSTEWKKRETQKTRAKQKKASTDTRKLSAEVKKPEEEVTKASTEAKKPDGERKELSAEPKNPNPETKKSSADTKKPNPGVGFGGFGLTSNRAPVDITSDTLEANNKQSIVIFKGNVVAKQEDVTVFTNVMTVYYDSETKKVKEIVATGNVKIVQLDKRATSQKATFYQNENKVVLEGDAVLRDGDNVVRGERVTHFADEDKTIVEGAKGGNRVSTRITPSQKDQREEDSKQKAKEKGEQ